MKNLILNPGSTSTKIAVYDAQAMVFSKTIKHPQKELERFNRVMDQKQYRLQAILDACNEQGIALEEISAAIGIGAFIYPSASGVYEVNEAMVRDLLSCDYGEHPANLGGVLASEIASRLNIKAYIADPITTDEFQEVARMSGLPDIARNGKTHTLNQKAVAARAVKDLGIPRESCKLVITHLGGGITVAAHLGNLIIDSNDPWGEGPFCMDRAGGVNCFEVAKLCFSGKYSKDDLLKRLNNGGGVVAYLDTRDFFDVMRLRAEKNPKAIAVYDAMVYQIAKEIGAKLAALRGKADAIVYTGGMAREKEFIDDINGYVGHFARALVYPGEFELESLADYAAKVQSGEITPLVYKGKP